MTAILKKISEATHKVFIVLAVFFLIMVVASSTIQVIARYVFNNSQSWTEELARYCFIWLTMCGTSMAAKNKTHAVLDFIAQKFKGRLHTAHEAVVNLIIMGVSILLVYQSFNLLGVTSSQLSVAMRIPMMYVYLAIPVGALGVFIHALSNLFSTLWPQKGESRFENAAY